MSIPPHPADGMVARLDVGDGAQVDVIDPRSFSDGGLEWSLRYGDAVALRYVAAGVVNTLDHLCSDGITTAEAIRRLRLMRAERRRLAAQKKEGDR